MKATMKRAIKDETGAALALALVLLVIGGLVLTPLLGLMSTGLIAGQVYEKKTDELYAADAGVEDAIWRILTNNLTFGTNNSSDPWHLTVNSRNVTVVVYREDLDLTPCEYDFRYQILSTAVTDEGGGTAALSDTMVEAYVESLVLDILSGALVSSKSIDFSGGCSVVGDVYYVEEITGKEYEHTDGVEEQIPLSAFPTELENQEFADQLKEEALLGGTHNGTMTIDSDTPLGPLYINGNLDIWKDVTVTLNGTIYVEGNIGSDKEYTIIGSGSIVAVGDINLHMMPDYGVEGDTIIMSLNGGIKFWKNANLEAMVYAPNGFIDIEKDMTVHGGIIGAGINVKKDSSFTYVSKVSSFGFFDPVVYGLGIRTYEINPPEL